MNLATFRAYDPSAGRWISRDPIGERGDPSGNLYGYVGQNLLVNLDPDGRCGPACGAAAGAIGGAVGGAAASLASQLLHNGGNFGCVNWSDVGRSAAIGAVIGAGVGSGLGWLAARGGATLTADVIASTPVGRSGNPMEVQPGTNQPGSVGGRDYTGHAFDQMQGRGIPSSVVENTIQNGISRPGNLPGRTTFYDPINNVTAVTDTITGRVITVYKGFPGGQK